MTQATEVSEVLKLFQAIQADIQDIKLSQVRVEEKLNAVDQRVNDLDKSLNKRIDSLKQRNNAQDARFWGLISIIGTALLGLLARLTFFSGGQA
jgi:FtsZ-binding cell division protein ZapB